MKVINLFAGPGAGKSTVAASLFVAMKNNGVNVELVTEYAKDLTWEKRFDLLTDQLYITAKQNRRLDRLRGEVDWIVSDSPLLLGYHYALPDYLPKTFKPLLMELWASYENVNYFLKRTKPYKQKGRTQTEEGAKLIDKEIHDGLLVKENIPFGTVTGDQAGSDEILRELKFCYGLGYK